MLFSTLCILVMLMSISHAYRACIRRPIVSSGWRLFSTQSNLVYFQQQFALYRSSFQGLTDSQVEQLSMFCDELGKWNAKVNLISRKDIDNIVERHVVPALTMTLVHKFGKGERVVDVGTGGGFPGIPLAIACPTAQVTLLDSSVKKTGVLSAMVASLQLPNVDVVTDRAELHKGRKYDLIVGRAVTSIPEFVSWTAHMLPRKAVRRKDGILYLSGGDISTDIEALNLRNHSIHNVAELVPNLETDKFVLRIPAGEVLLNRPRASARKLGTPKAQSGRGSSKVPAKEVEDPEAE